jgi:hypothetical protein
MAKIYWIYTSYPSFMPVNAGRRCSFGYQMSIIACFFDPPLQGWQAQAASEVECTTLFLGWIIDGPRSL